MGFVHTSISCSSQQMFEDLSLRTTVRPRMWRRYVDDTFCVMEKQHTQLFLDHLNSLRPTIQFTMELERDGKLLFLDTLLTRREDGRVNIGIYRRKHTPIGICRPPCTCKVGGGILPVPSYQDYSIHRAF